MTNVKVFKSNITSCIFIALIVISISGCGGTAMKRLDNIDENSAFVQIIINDNEIKDKEDGSKLVDALKDVLSHSFKYVSVQRGYNSQKVGELVVTPQSLSLSASDLKGGKLTAYANSTIKVLTFADYKLYTLSGIGEYELSLVEKIALVPAMMGVGIAGTFVGKTEEGARAPTKLWNPVANNRALESLAVEFHNELISSSKFKTYAESAKMLKTELADLSLSVRFSDNAGFFPNNTIDAGEDAEMIVAIKNTGKGTGYGTVLEIISDNQKITFNKEIRVGDIQPNETKEIKIPLKAGLDIVDGKASFQFNLKEKRGYDAKKVVMYVPTARLESPQLEIASTEINDGDTGLAKGNGNGIPESGETIELTVFVKNQGEGKAIGVNLKGEDITHAIQWIRDSTLIGIIPQGEVVKGKVAFTIPRNFDAKEIATTLKLTETRGVGNTEKRVALSYAKKSPNIQYSYRIYSKGKEVSTITNGEDHEIELSLTNSGQIPAKGVVITINPPIPPLTKEGEGGLSLSRTKIDVGEIKEKTSVAGQRFAFSVPRQFAEKEASLNIKITQSDFSSTDSPIRIPVDVKSPRLKYTANLLSRGGSNNLEHGEQAILEIQVLNEGNLSAEGVKIKIESRDENLKVMGQTEALLGKIPVNSKSETIKFQLFAMRKIKVGDTGLGINITQNEFQPVVSQYALNIKEEGAIVVDVTAEDRVKTAGIKTQSGPAINLKTAQIAETTTDESFRLAFEVTDSRNIETIKVEINGVVIPLDEKAGLTLRASKKKEIVKNIPLKEGENKIVITAYNTDNIPSMKALIVTRIGEEDVDSPPLTNMRNPDAVAVVIGISRFENKDITPVDYAKRDAMTMKEYLIKTLGFDEKNITEFYDEKATSKKLEIFFNTHIKNKVKQGISDVFIFYSGHGVPDTNSNEAYFAPYDLDVTDVKTSGYKVTELYNKLEAVKARSVTVAIDACYSGFSGGDKPQPIIKSASPLVMTVENPLFTMKNGVVFTASTGKQIASWYHKKQHGIFTYYFLQGLRGKADTDKDGQISVRELKGYLVKNVKEQASLLYNREQIPEVMGNEDTALVRFK